MHTATELKKALQEIFADGYVDPAERKRLAEFRDLSDETTVKVFREFLRERWGEAIKDGVITAEEKRLLAHILEELALQLSHLPEDAQFALRDHT